MSSSNYVLRPAQQADAAAMARMWHDAWHDGHADLVDPVWRRHRNRQNFLDRVGAIIPNATVAEDATSVLGYSSIHEDEMHQLFVDSKARGSGIAGELLDNAENRLWRSGITRAWLYCVKGNDRAFRFYEKMGWVTQREEFQSLDLNGKEYRVEVYRMEKDLKPD